MNLVKSKQYQEVLLDEKSLFYLASPFTSKNTKEEEQRLEEINQIGGILTLNKVHCILPISSSYALGKTMKLPSSFDFWKDLDLLYVEKCDAVIVANMDGWKISIGVQAEIKHAKKLGKPVYLLNVQKLIDLHTTYIKEI